MTCTAPFAWVGMAEMPIAPVVALIVKQPAAAVLLGQGLSVVAVPAAISAAVPTWTAVAFAVLVPVMVTDVPVGPLAGEMARLLGA